MEFKFNANMVDGETSRISSAVRPTFRTLADRLTGDYGGIMQHLWIDLELLRSHVKADGSAKHPFRFQKRVSGRGPFGLPDQPDSFNVGHFSVRPDFERLLSIPADEVVPYALSLIHRASGCPGRKAQEARGIRCRAVSDSVQDRVSAARLRVRELTSGKGDGCRPHAAWLAQRRQPATTGQSRTTATGQAIPFS